VPVDPLSQVFSALADPIRRDIVARLTSGDATVRELAAPYTITVQAVSKHLRVLEDSGLVSRSRDAQRRPAHLETEVFDLMTMWIERNRREAELRYRHVDEVLHADQVVVVPAEEDEEPVRIRRWQPHVSGAGRVFQPWDLTTRTVPPEDPSTGTTPPA
jgi:DNA-binding transcriptional ArsR family regulator